MFGQRHLFVNFELYLPFNLIVETSPNSIFEL